MRRDANFIRGTLAGLGLLGCMALAGALAAATAYAGAPIQVPVDEARIVKLADKPGTIIVGNPSIADVSLRNGTLLIVQGKSYGATNIIVLTRDGKQIANMDVLVQARYRHALSVFSSSGRKSFRCKPFCEPELNAGDDASYFSQVQTQSSTKSKTAESTGKKDTEETKK